MRTRIQGNSLMIPLIIIFVMCFCINNSIMAQIKGEKLMKIVSTAFKAGEIIPQKYTCDDADISPPLSWENIPESTKSLALICDDPDAPIGIWVHWVLYNISPEINMLAENVPAQRDLANGARQGINDFRKLGYGGPCPPGGTHRYYFKLYALDSTLGLTAGATKGALEAAMDGHILAQAELMGTYSR